MGRAAYTIVRREWAGGSRASAVERQNLAAWRSRRTMGETLPIRQSLPQAPNTHPARCVTDDVTPEAVASADAPLSQSKIGVAM